MLCVENVGLKINTYVTCETQFTLIYKIPHHKKSFWSCYFKVKKKKIEWLSIFTPSAWKNLNKITIVFSIFTVYDWVWSLFVIRRPFPITSYSCTRIMQLGDAFQRQIHRSNSEKGEWCSFHLTTSQDESEEEWSSESEKHRGPLWGGVLTSYSPVK